MKIIFMGTPDFSVPSLESLINSGHDVAAVFTQPDKPKGRGMKLLPSPVKEYAEKQGIPVYQPQSLKKQSEEFTPLIKSLEPDCIVVVAYGKILPPEVLSIPKYGCINVHGSLLPKYRGAAPIQRTVLNGDPEGGITTMLMSEGMDEGDILLKRAVGVDENETSAEYYERLSHIGAELLIKTLCGVSDGSVKPVPQDGSLATYAPMLTKDMSPTDFYLSARDVYNHINGLSDRPGATAILDGRRVKLLRAGIYREEGELGAPGEIIDEKAFAVACGKGAIVVLEIQSEGGKRMKTADYLRGKPVKAGTVLTAG